LRPGDVVVALLPGARVTKVRPAVVVSTELYHRERPDPIVGILTTQIPDPLKATDHLLVNWREASLRAPSCFRLYLITVLRTDVAVIGRLSERDWAEVQARLRCGLAVTSGH